MAVFYINGKKVKPFSFMEFEEDETVGSANPA